ncbi:MAG TPA: 30S ribosomal protein S12 methylthiotransferase RimO [Clostridiales bacterium]|nr:30S ribosomal protein S12 methylthiotransferase RimO [Clostridiales bacterium]
MKIGVISLGCSKNRVDTEVMLGLLKEEGYEFVQDMQSADIMLINTCTFIDEAKEEAINTVLEAEQQKRFRHLKGIIVTGCMPELYKEELKRQLPRVDAFLGVAAYKDILEAVREVSEGRKFTKFARRELEEEFSRRVITTQKPTAYVKIAEGCGNHCSYCVIPSVRGPYQSREMQNILDEIAGLVKEGYSEIILVAQDTTNYGTDIYGSPSLPKLLESAAQTDGVKWLRVMYFYPDAITDELLDVMLKHENIIKYIDMPVQHTADDILKAMNRRYRLAQVEETVDRIRKASPEFAIRSTVIVGFPGSSGVSTTGMSKKLKELKFDHLGVFAYSPQEGTPAAMMPGQIDEAEKEFRKDAIMNVQATISHERNRERIGKTAEVLVEGKDGESGAYYGRAAFQAPEVDGITFIETAEPLEIGKYYKAKIARAYHYDCVAELIPESGE